MLSQKQLSKIMINLICVKLLLIYPRELIKNSGCAAWLEMLFVTVLALALFFLTKKVYVEKKNIVELAHIKFGKTGRIIVGLICITTLFCAFISVVRIFPESVKIVLLQDTDTDLILGIFIFSSCIGAYFGLRAISKITSLFLPFAAVLFVGFLIFLTRNYRIQNMMPIFGLGIKNLFIGGVGSLFVFVDIIILNLLIPHTKTKKDVWNSGIAAILISGIVGILICLAYALIFPYPASKEFIMPVYQLTRIINLSSFFNRFEAVFQFAWSILVFLYGSTYIYVICYTWQITFSLKHLNPLIFSFAIICGAIALLPDSFMSAIRFSGYVEAYAYLSAFVLPIIIGISKPRHRNL